MGFVQAGKTPGLAQAWFLTNKMYFGDDPPEVVVSKWKSKVEASSIEIHKNPRRQNPTGIDKELSDCIEKAAESAIGFGSAVAPDAVVRMRKIADMQHLVRRGASIDNAKGLHIAAEVVATEGDNFILHTLVRLGGNVNLQDHVGNTPLHQAARALCAPNIRYLLSVGADPSVTNLSEMTPLEVIEATCHSINDFVSGFGMLGRARDLSTHNILECTTELMAAQSSSNN
jgi:hypothetical protein